MKRYPFLDLALSNAPYMEELKAAACDVIERGRYLQSTQTELLEQEIAATCQARHCISVSNGLDALRLILRAYKENSITITGGIGIARIRSQVIQEKSSCRKSLFDFSSTLHLGQIPLKACGGSRACAP